MHLYAYSSGLLCSPCPLGTLCRICLVLPKGDSPRLVWLVMADDSPPFCAVLDCLCPVLYATKVIIDQATPAQGCSTWMLFLSTWSASHKLSRGKGLASSKHVQTTAVFSVANGPPLIAHQSSPGWYCFKFCPTR